MPAPECVGNCPGPGVCDACDDRLYESLLADESFMAGYYEWERMNVPGCGWEDLAKKEEDL